MELVCLGAGIAIGAAWLVPALIWARSEVADAEEKTKAYWERYERNRKKVMRRWL